MKEKTLLLVPPRGHGPRAGDRAARRRQQDEASGAPPRGLRRGAAPLWRELRPGVAAGGPSPGPGPGARPSTA